MGNSIENSILKPGPERLKSIMDLPSPKEIASSRSALKMFAHYYRWILVYLKIFDLFYLIVLFLLQKQLRILLVLFKADITNASLAAIQDNIPFRVEDDGFEFSIGAILNQAGRPIAFYSSILNFSERKPSSVEKEAYAIVESLRNWRYYLIARHF